MKMQSQALKVFISIFFGAFVGGTVALELAKPFWWIGALFGGAIGYLSYERKQVVTAIPKAWNAVTGWRISQQSLLRFGLYQIGFFCVFTWLGIFGYIDAVFGHKMIHFVPNALFLAVLSFSIGTFMFIANKDELESDRENDADKVMKLMIKYALPCVLFYHLPRGIIWLVPRVPGFVQNVAVFVARFVRELVRLINSDMRIICGSYAMIGAAVGYFYGYAAVGALLAAFVGALHDIFIRHYRPEWRRIQ